MGQPIDKLTIKGFKSIKSLVDFELHSLNVLIGANGAGKSNFIAFFELLRQVVSQNLQDYLRQKGGPQGGADLFLYLGPKYTKSIKGEFLFGQNAYKLFLQWGVKNLLYIKEDKVGYFGGNYTSESWEIITQAAAESQLSKKKDNPGRTAQRGPAYYAFDAINDWIVYHLHDTSDTASIRYKAWPVRDSSRLHSDGGNLPSLLLNLKEQERQTYDSIRDTIRLVAPFFDDFVLEPKSNGSGDELVLLEWKQKGAQYRLHPSQLSDGTLRFICLSVAMLQPHPPSTLIIDEPELGLHPYALSVLASLFKQAAAKGVQVIVSTQSALLVDDFQPEDVIVVDRREGASTFRRLKKNDLTAWLKNYSLGELWQKNVFEGGPAHE